MLLLVRKFPFNSPESFPVMQCLQDKFFIYMQKRFAHAHDVHKEVYHLGPPRPTFITHKPILCTQSYTPFCRKNSDVISISSLNAEHVKSCVSVFYVLSLGYWLSLPMWYKKNMFIEGWTGESSNWGSASDRFFK